MKLETRLLFSPSVFFQSFQACDGEQKTKASKSVVDQQLASSTTGTGSNKIGNEETAKAKETKKGSNHAQASKAKGSGQSAAAVQADSSEGGHRRLSPPTWDQIQEFLRDYQLIK